ncbi:MAG TPA: PEGA domain-containing protein [Kofleriaceae bacterium]|nr:PEGA domain-containing protein [Kofleriaceae bacterium]
MPPGQMGMPPGQMPPGAFPSPPQPFLPGTPPPGPGQAFATRQLQASLELDEIPDKFKIRRRAQISPIWIAAGAAVLAATVAGILIAIYGGGSGEASRGEATVKVVSSPQGAVVTVDGEQLPDPTPTSFQGKPGQKYLIRLDLPRYQRWEREHLVPADGREGTVVARLDPIVVKVKVTSTPPGAEVFIGGTSVGRTPLELGGLDPQTSRSIEVRLKGYRPVRRILDWSRETEKDLLFELEP